MASWGGEVWTTHPVDFQLVRDGFVTMFWQRSLLDETTTWLQEHQYDVVRFEASAWASAADMLDDLARGLDFPDYFGRNLNALNDCMSDVAHGDYGWRPEAVGLVVVLTSFDTFATLDRQTAQGLLEVVARQARAAMLIGNRILCLVQTNDPSLSFEPVGASAVTWNAAEWPSSARGL